MNAIFKRTKILATVGPATNSYQLIKDLATSGVNGYRHNFSHGTYEERDQQMEWIRKVSEELKRPVAILQDLQGPKIRLGNLVDNHLPVKKGDELVLDHAVEHDGSLTLPVQYNLAGKVKVGEPIYLFDGKVRTTVLEIPSPTAVRVRVENDGILMSRKGLNLPDTDFGGDILTPKDLKDIEYGVTKDYDYVSLSFVQSPDDIVNLRKILRDHGSDAKVIAKIETKAAIQEGVLEEIVKESDGIMVARGDLAVEAGARVVPIVQRRIVGLCHKYGKLSIVATQMMASMVDNPEPTRAEVGDVANAVMQGADTVMLSDETANGKFPIETVEAMRHTILYTQEHTTAKLLEDADRIEGSQRDAIAVAAVTLAEKLGADAIVAETKTGATAANVAAHRPNLPIISVTSSKRTAQQLALSYANRSFVRPDGEYAGIELAEELKKADYFGDDAEKVTVVTVSGRQPGLEGTTDTIRVRVLE